MNGCLRVNVIWAKCLLHKIFCHGFNVYCLNLTLHEHSTPSDRIIIGKLSKLSAHCSAKCSWVFSNIYQNSIVVISSYYYGGSRWFTCKFFAKCWSCKALNKYISVQSSLLSSIISHFNVKTCLIFTYLFKTKPAVAFWTFCNGFFIYLEVLSNKTLQ